VKVITLSPFFYFLRKKGKEGRKTVRSREAPSPRKRRGLVALRLSFSFFEVVRGGRGRGGDRGTHSPERRGVGGKMNTI